MIQFSALIGVAAALSLGLAHASAASTLVPGAANPNLAGQAVGTACCSGDSVPGQAPTLAASGFAAGAVFTFGATGSTDGAGTGPTGPEGASLFDMTDYNLGVAPAKQVRILGLVGVFLDDGAPTAAGQPAALDFSGGLDFASLSPGLDQIFWIGDGLTGAGSGSVQTFIAPTGATRLFLGTVDGYQWNNNTGDYAVTVDVTSGGAISAAPEPTAWVLMFAGVGLCGLALRRRSLTGHATCPA